jgi:hypothetical protein
LRRSPEEIPNKPAPGPAKFFHTLKGCFVEMTVTIQRLSNFFDSFYHPVIFLKKSQVFFRRVTFSLKRESICGSSKQKIKVMKTILIVLLIAAIGGGAYYYFSNKKQNHSSSSQELVVGKWAVDSVDASHSKDSSAMLVAVLLAPDSNGHKFQFEFLKNGQLVEGNEKKPGDTSYYEFDGNKDLLVWSKNDSAKTKLFVSKLDSLSFIVRDKDSVVYTLSKLAGK